MMRSMFSAISGLRNHQTFMDVVGNNIANVNTTGFKQSRVIFQDILSQTVKNASSPQGNRGGTNPGQVGLGVLISSIETLHTQGTLQSTGKATDMAIQGDGFFVLNDGSSQYFSRDGSFDLAVDGTLVNPSSGLKIQGWQADSQGVVNTSAALTGLTIPIGQGMEGQESDSATFTGNLDSAVDQMDWASSNPSGGKLTVDGTFTGTAGTAYKITINTVNASGDVTSFDWQAWDPAAGAGAGALGAATTVASNSFTDGGLTFTVAASTNTQADDIYYTNAQVSTVTLYDSLGEPHSVRTVFQKTPGSTSNQRDWTWGSYVYGSSTNPSIDVTPAGNTITFDNAGKVDTGSTASVDLDSTSTPAAITNGAKDMTVTFDFAAMTQLSGTGDVTATTDGAAAGSLSSFIVGQSGEITGVYSNGLKRTLGQLALATFANPTGLMKSGGNLYATSANSGTARIGTPDSNGRGQVSTGFLEMSNVDLAQQFTNLIMAERGFQANSRVITTSDELLQDLVSLKR